MSYALREDANTKMIVAALRAAGCAVAYIKSARNDAGLPDLLVGFNGVNYLIEVKSPKGKPSDEQIKWHNNWRGRVEVARNEQEALAIVFVDKIIPKRRIQAVELAGETATTEPQA